MDDADRAAAVTDAFLENAQQRFRRDAVELSVGALVGPVCCGECGEAIPDARRRAMPRARLCVDCQSELERRR